MATSFIQAIVLAAGESTRFGTKISKLSFSICGEPMVTYPIKLLFRLKIKTTVVIGFQEKIVKEIVENCEVPNISFIEQKERLGTGHALLCTKNSWNSENILVLNGDIPLISQKIILALLKKHKNSNATLSFVTANCVSAASSNYGRVIEEEGKISIVEARNFTGKEKIGQLVNAGVYLVKRKFLDKVLQKIKPNEKTGEIYITELIRHASENGEKVSTTLEPFDSIRGINTLRELLEAEKIKRSEIISTFMENGVRFASAQNVCIDLDVSIGANSFVGSNTTILKGTRIGENSTIFGSSIISQSRIGNDTKILPFSVIENSEICENATVGPFAHLRTGTILEKNSLVGNFVEIKKSTLGENSKAKHLSYLGDTEIGKNVNIGAGTITCNYDGFNKNKTLIEDGAFIGTNNALVAPVTIGKGSITAAGSVITKDVPDNTLAIARERQTNKEGYAKKIREKLKKKSKNTVICATKEKKLEQE